MHITVSGSELARAVATAARFADKRSTLPILAGVRVSVHCGALTLDTTDLCNWASVDVHHLEQYPRCEDGAIIVDAAELLAAVKGATGQVDLTATADALTVVSAAARKTLTMLAKITDWPKAPKVPTLTTCNLGALADALARVAPAMSVDESRYHLCGAFLTSDDGGKLRAVATDGHRLHLVDVDAGWLPKVPTILPRRAALELTRIGRDVEQAKIGQSETHFAVTVGALTLTTKPVEAQFPPYQQVIQSADNAKVTIKVEAGALASATREMVTARGKSEAIGSSIGVHGARMRVRYEGTEKTAAADLACWSSGESAAIAVNAAYVADACRAADGLPLTVRIAGELDPVRIDFDGGTCVIMPYRADAAQLVATIPEESDAPNAATVEPKKAKAPKVKAPIAAKPKDFTPAPLRSVPTLATYADDAARALQVVALLDWLRSYSGEQPTASDPLACYRCKAHTEMGYILAGQVCCRDCRGAHRVDYYASQGRTAPPRRERSHGGKVTSMVVHAESVTVAAS